MHTLVCTSCQHSLPVCSCALSPPPLLVLTSLTMAICPLPQAVQPAWARCSFEQYMRSLSTQTLLNQHDICLPRQPTNVPAAATVAPLAEHIHERTFSAPGASRGSSRREGLDLDPGSLPAGSIPGRDGGEARHRAETWPCQASERKPPGDRLDPREAA